MAQPQPGKGGKKGKAKGFRIGPYNGYLVLGGLAAAIAIGLYLRRRTSSSTGQTQQATDPTGSTGAGAGGGDTTGGAGSAGADTATLGALSDISSQLADLTSLLGGNGGTFSDLGTYDPNAYTDTTGGMSGVTVGQALSQTPHALSDIYAAYHGGGGNLTATNTHKSVAIKTHKIPSGHGHVVPGKTVKFASTAKLGKAPTLHKKTQNLPKQTAGGAATKPGRQL